MTQTDNEFADPGEELDPVAAIEKRRAKRKADLAEQERAQLATDLEAIDALEQEHGDSNIVVLKVPFMPGLPVRIAARTPSDPELKRYRARLKPKNPNQSPDTVAAAEELADVTRVYPPRDDAGNALFARLLEARPAVKVQLGAQSVGLAAASADDAGKG